ncbi:hypothetical protein [Streptomyces sp. S1]|uniref:hypothetical protein n=1 Tax=Streptomyces sp. S1 TaxID=718288 RepID=UPI003D71063C
MTVLLPLLCVLVYLAGVLAAARLIFVRRKRSGDWDRTYDALDNFMPMMAGSLLWPFGLVYLWATRPLKEERASKLQKRITELEKELLR